MLVELASTPVAAGLFFLYIKDKYEKEPWKMLFLGVLFGLYTAAVVYALGAFRGTVSAGGNTVLHGFFQLGGGGGGCEVSVSDFSHLGQPATSMSRLTGLYTAYLFRSALRGGECDLCDAPDSWRL